MKFMECAVRDVIYGTNVRIVKPVNILNVNSGTTCLSAPSLRYRKAVSLAVEAGSSRTRLSVKT